MSHADAIDTSWLSLRALFPDTLDREAESVINEIVRQGNPPFKVVTESTWALKVGRLTHCAVCQNVRGLRVVLPRERRGLCNEHAGWRIFYVHHSWSLTEQRQAALRQLRDWLNHDLAPRVG